MRILILSLTCLLSFFALAEEELSVQVGESFKVSLPVTVPNAALDSLRIYFDSLIFSRPIPNGYFLESYKINTEKGVVELSGRIIEEGDQTLFLGTFVWGGTIFTLPSIKIKVSPLSGISLSAKDLLLPYPEQAFHETKENIILKETLLKHYLQKVNSILRQQKNFKNGSILFLFLLLISPMVFWLLNRKIKTMEFVKKEIPLEEELSSIRESKDWTRLLAFLQRLSEKEECLTSYELSGLFSRKGNKNLVQAALYIEKYGYLPNTSLERFDEAVDSVSASLAVKSV